MDDERGNVAAAAEHAANNNAAANVRRQNPNHQQRHVLNDEERVRYGQLSPGTVVVVTKSHVPQKQDFNARRRSSRLLRSSSSSSATSSSSSPPKQEQEEDGKDEVNRDGNDEGKAVEEELGIVLGMNYRYELQTETSDNNGPDDNNAINGGTTLYGDGIMVKLQSSNTRGIYPPTAVRPFDYDKKTTKNKAKGNAAASAAAKNNNSTTDNKSVSNDNSNSKKSDPPPVSASGQRPEMDPGTTEKETESETTRAAKVESKNKNNSKKRSATEAGVDEPTGKRKLRRSARLSAPPDNDPPPGVIKRRKDEDDEDDDDDNEDGGGDSGEEKKNDPAQPATNREVKTESSSTSSKNGNSAPNTGNSTSNTGNNNSNSNSIYAMEFRVQAGSKSSSCSKCQECQETIRKGTMRLQVKGKKRGHWYHVACAAVAAARAAREQHDNDDEDDGPSVQPAREVEGYADLTPAERTLLHHGLGQPMEAPAVVTPSSPAVGNENGSESDDPPLSTLRTMFKPGEMKSVVKSDNSDGEESTDIPLATLRAKTKTKPPKKPAQVRGNNNKKDASIKEERKDADDDDDSDDGPLIDDSDVDSDDGRNRPYRVEYSSTNRAACKSCDEKIAKGEIRIAERPLFRGKPGFVIYRHLNCTVFAEHIKFAHQIGGWRRLKKSSRDALQRRIDKSLTVVEEENKQLEPDELVQASFQGEIRKAPPGLSGNLLPFQVEGASWMRCQECEVPDIRGGILADEMGMGKTLQTITTILDNRPTLQHSKPGMKHPPHASDIKDREREEALWAESYKSWEHEMEMANVPKKLWTIDKKKHTGKNTAYSPPGSRAGTLVVCPIIALLQWKEEIKKFTENDETLSVCFYHGPNRIKEYPREILSKYDIVLTTYQTIEADFRKMVSPNKVKCPNCGGSFKVDKLRVHLKYFCGESAQRTEAQQRQRRTANRHADGGMQNNNRNNRFRRPPVLPDSSSEDEDEDDVETRKTTKTKKKATTKRKPATPQTSASKKTKKGQSTKATATKKQKRVLTVKKVAAYDTESDLSLPDEEEEEDEEEKAPTTTSVGKRSSRAAARTAKQRMSASKGQWGTTTKGQSKGTSGGDDDDDYGSDASTGSDSEDDNDDDDEPSDESSYEKPTRRRATAQGGTKRGKSVVIMDDSDNGGGDDDDNRGDDDGSNSDDDDSDDDSEVNPALARARKRQRMTIQRNSKSSKKKAKPVSKAQVSAHMSKKKMLKPKVKKFNKNNKNNVKKKKKTPVGKKRKAPDDDDYDYDSDDSSDDSTGSDSDPEPRADRDPLADIDLDKLMKEAMAGSRASVLHTLCWWRIVLDEAHMIKTRSSQTAAAAFALTSIHRWCLSGTPLQNRVGELYSLIRFLRIDPMAHYFCRAAGCNCKSIHYRMINQKCQDCGHGAVNHFSHFNKHVLNPIKRTGYQGDGRRAIMKLKDEVLDRALLRRTKQTRAEDMKLPPRVVTIRYIRLHPIEEDFYGALYTQTKSSFDDYVTEGTILNNYAHIFDLLTRMRQAVDHPYLLVFGKRNMERQAEAAAAEGTGAAAAARPAIANGSADCSLCHEPPTDRVVSSCCQSAFCRSCVIDFMSAAIQAAQANGAAAAATRTSCPCCRAPFSVDLNQASSDVVDDGTLDVSSGRDGKKSSSSSNPDLDKAGLPSLKEMSHVSSGSILRRINLAEFATSTKIEALVQELVQMRQQRPGSKALVFSQFVNMLDLVRWRLHSDPCLQDLGIGVRIIHGGMNVQSRDTSLKDFREDPSVRVLLMSLKAGGVALNLTVANEVYLLDPWWNPAAEMQAIDRTHRLGQHRPIRAVRFIAEGTVEERVLQLQEKKRLVFDGTVGRDAASLKMLTVDDMKGLFV